MLMVVDPLMAKIIERSRDSKWRRLDRSFLTNLHFQEHGWLKAGLEKERSSLNLSVWYPHQEWVRILQAHADARPDGAQPGLSRLDAPDGTGAGYPPIASYSNSGQDQGLGWSSASDSSRVWGGGGGSRQKDR